jgi:hypothetical protein
MSEADFQAELCRDLTQAGWVCIKLDPGTGTIPKGWPDLLLLHCGVVWFAEVKVPGGHVEPQQRRHMELLVLCEFNVCFIDPTPGNCNPRPWTYEEIHEYQPPGS